MGNYRNRKLLDLAHRLNQCTLQIPDVCIGYSPEGLEPCHSNWQEEGIGMGIKADDSVFAAGCHQCHMALDDGNKLNREEKIWFWRRGVIRTVRELFKREWIKVTA